MIFQKTLLQSKQYDPREIEPVLLQRWLAGNTYAFDRDSQAPIYSIDTPPPTVSGNLHLGHTYSYSHADFLARFWRMNGHNVFYPMGYDDNGLPTERLVEKQLGVTASSVGRAQFVQHCLQVSQAAEMDYQALWQRLGLSIDWRYTYRTIDERSRRLAQFSFIDLYRKGLIYRREAPTLWCPECQTALAQADVVDLERQSEFVTLDFKLADGRSLPVATTRPELLPACVAIFINPQDKRFQSLAGQTAQAPIFGNRVPILLDPGANPEIGSGVVMCCTYGDAMDLEWQRKHDLPINVIIQPDGRLSQAAGELAGTPILEARQHIKRALERDGLLHSRQPTLQTLRAHERCDTPVEFIITRQWFLRLLDFKEEFLKLGAMVAWHPEHMQKRYQAWVENLGWDWCISRQRFFGVPFPLWYCKVCGEAVLADESQLPVDPLGQSPASACPCGSRDFEPEPDVMDTWATSSLTPQIVGGWLDGNEELYRKVFPFSLRPQAHEIIRTWAFYTLVKAFFHSKSMPWKNALISGWGISGEGMGKISKSRGGGPMPPLEMIETYSADAVRYWAASTGPGKDAVISEEKIQLGAKLAVKLWNVARFSQRFLVAGMAHPGYSDAHPGYSDAPPGYSFTPADRWILSKTQQLVRRATSLMQDYDYASAKSIIESFFWGDLADNYLEMCKQRLYEANSPQQEAARFTLYHVLLTTIKLFAPFLPFVTEAIYLGLFTPEDEKASIHTSAWPSTEAAFEDQAALAYGESLIAIATAVRRYKSEKNLPLGSEIKRLQLATVDPGLAFFLRQAEDDLKSVCRAKLAEVVDTLDPGLHLLHSQGTLQIGIGP